MLDRIIKWSLSNRAVTLFAAAIIALFGAWTALTLPVDVFPDLTAPTVTVLTEAQGMAAEEVESLITFPIETAVNGARGVRRVRSSSLYGISIVWVDFDWETDVMRARQIVGERLQALADGLPEGVGTPVMAPVTSLMGEVMLIGLRGDDVMVVRSAADFTVRRRLLAIPGIAQVIPIGGDVKQYQVTVSPDVLRAYDLSLNDVLRAATAANRNSAGGIFSASGREIRIRGLGRVDNVEDIGASVITTRAAGPILLRDVATVDIGPAPRYGTASIDALPAVVLSVQKQPDANTLALTKLIDEELERLQNTLPVGVTVDRGVFRQADFIETAVHNVMEALRDGSLFVVLILALFLWSVRATAISLLAIPLSLSVALIAMKSIGATINTMTLGGMAIAVGALVDDAIIDVENVYRRLRERRGNALKVVYEASCEVRGPILYATLIICVVFVPFFFLGEVEGRLLRPLGFAYVTSVLASLFVAVSVTPALCSVLLPSAMTKESWVARRLRALYQPVLEISLRRPGAVIGVSATLLLSAIVMAPFLGRGFMPPFQEGTLVVSAITAPGTALEESDAMGRRIEEILLSHPAVVKTSRRTGRAELDEHAQQANASEIDISLNMTDHTLDGVLAELRSSVRGLPGMNLTFGQPIGHRIDHMLSGSRTSLVIKLFGPDLTELRILGDRIARTIRPVPGLVDLAVERLADVPQLRLYVDREAMALHGVTSAQLAEFVEAAIAGKAVSEVREGQEIYDLTVRFPAENRSTAAAIRRATISTPTGGRIAFGLLADVREERGPNAVSRENAQRVLAVTANAAGRDVGSVLADIESRISDMALDEGYSVEIGGRIESAKRATRTLVSLSLGVLVIIFLILLTATGSARVATLVLVNLPLALTGGIWALFASGGEVNVAALVGFITLFGIAVRNGLLLVTHYHTLSVEGARLRDAVVRGSLERLNPILMTALTAALALLPLALGGGEPGKEIQTPMAIVILGGLLTSTLLNMIVVPVLYLRTARRSA